MRQKVKGNKNLTILNKVNVLKPAAIKKIYAADFEQVCQIMFLLASIGLFVCLFVK